MTPQSPFVTLRIDLPDPDATALMAAGMAALLGPGDVLLLDGPVGVGKTHFARSLILSLLPEPEDVPSPTFTLVQTYETAEFEIWHSDLYRLTTPDEVIELGLIDAFQDSLCLIEWPDRLGDLTPDQALSLTFSYGADPGMRHLEVSGRADRWSCLLSQVQAA